MSRRGVIQGDALSLLLFVLAADVFTQMIILAAEKVLIQGLGLMGFSQKVLSLQYANDTLLFCKAAKEQLVILNLLLYGFELASGLNLIFIRVMLLFWNRMMFHKRKWQGC